MSGGYSVKSSWKDISGHALMRFGTDFQVYFPPALLASALAYLCIYFIQTIREKRVITSFHGDAIGRFIISRLLHVLTGAYFRLLLSS